MPSGRQEALIVPPCGVQVGPGAVGGIITPRSLVQHGDGQDEEEEGVVAERRCGSGGEGKPKRKTVGGQFVREQRKRSWSVEKYTRKTT